jgi:hypothetical protein
MPGVGCACAGGESASGRSGSRAWGSSRWWIVNRCERWPFLRPTRQQVAVIPRARAGDEHRCERPTSSRAGRTRARGLGCHPSAPGQSGRCATRSVARVPVRDRAARAGRPDSAPGGLTSHPPQRAALPASLPGRRLRRRRVPLSGMRRLPGGDSRGAVLVHRLPGAARLPGGPGQPLPAHAGELTHARVRGAAGSCGWRLNGSFLAN